MLPTPELQRSAATMDAVITCLVTGTLEDSQAPRVVELLSLSGAGGTFESHDVVLGSGQFSFSAFTESGYGLLRATGVEDVEITWTSAACDGPIDVEPLEGSIAGCVEPGSVDVRVEVCGRGPVALDGDGCFFEHIRGGRRCWARAYREGPPFLVGDVVWSRAEDASEGGLVLEAPVHAAVHPGVGFRWLAGVPTVESVQVGSVGHAAGVQVGDQVVAVDGLSGRDLTSYDLSRLSLGPRGTSTRLELVRDREHIEVTLVRGSP